MGELLGFAKKAVITLAKAVATLIAGSSVGAKAPTQPKPLPTLQPIEFRQAAPSKESKIVLVGKNGEIFVISSDSGLTDRS